MQGRPLIIRVVVMRQGDQWLAQGLEFNLSTQAPSEPQAVRGFLRVLTAHIRRDHELGRQPLQGVPPAPERFEDLWAHVTKEMPWQQVVIGDLSNDIPPAYILPALAQNGSDAIQ
jgi:hypothetical protein